MLSHVRFCFFFFSPINKTGQTHHHFTKYFKSWHTRVSTIKKSHGTKNSLTSSLEWHLEGKKKKTSKNENMGIPRQKFNPFILLISSFFPILDFFVAELQPQGWDTLRCQIVTGGAEGHPLSSSTFCNPTCASPRRILSPRWWHWELWLCPWCLRGSL